MKRRTMQWTLMVIAGLGLALVGWLLAYPSSSDPKNLKYQLWKMGLMKMDLDTATGTMVGDGASKRLVLGKTRSELQQRFGVLLAPSEANPYLGGFYRQSPWNGQEVVFLRSSPWMVVFKNGVATDLVLVKGY